MSRATKKYRTQRILALSLATAIGCTALTPSVARAEPITMGATALVLGVKAVIAKLSAAHIGAALVPVAVGTAVRTIAVNQAVRAAAVTQVGRTVAARSALTMTPTHVAVARAPAAGITVNLNLNRGAVTALLSAAGVGATSGSSAADDELVAELAVARASGVTEHRQLVCERADRTVYAVPSSWERCPSAGETLKALERPLNPQTIR